MNPIQKAINDIKFKIPAEVLTAAFTPRVFGQRPLPINLDAMIRDKVIEGKVRPDCDLNGGIEMLIPLISVHQEFLDPFTVVMRIPKNLTQNRNITRVVSMNIGTGQLSGAATMGLYGYSQVLDAAAGVMASQAAIPIVSTAYVQLISENTILVSDNMALPNNVHLRCYVENDEDFTHLRSTTYNKFSKLVELATKTYIYNNLVIPVGQGLLVGGIELGRFREIIDSYADSAELYETYLEETWKKVTILDDGMSRERHLRMIMGGHR